MEYIDSILSILKYNPNEPLIFTSGLFLFLFLVFTAIYYMLRNKLNARILFVIAFSIYFYYKTSGLFFLLLIFVSLNDYTIARLIAHTPSRLKRKLLVALSCIVNLGLLCYFKYTDFFIEILNNFVEKPFNPLNIFLPIGISFFTFQSMSYVFDVYRLRIKPLHYYWDYLFYVSFFPQLVAGPIVRARDFVPQINRNNTLISKEIFSESIFLIMSGLFKKTIISDYISQNFVDRIFDDPLLYSGFENLMGVYGYSLQIYCDFSGYSDMAIGIALMLGYRFNANFNSPYKSATITEFWRRWHISLSSWLKDYLYISMGGNRKGKIRTYINLMTTMLLGGLWHGAALRFILWGAIHGISLGVHKFVMDRFSSFKAQGEDMSRLRRIIGIIITFHLVCFSWIFFRAESMEKAGDMLSQIATKFHPEIWLDFFIGYRWVTILIIIGFLLHFTSDKIEKQAIAIFSKLPIIFYPIIISAIIWLMMQIRNGEIQPFIYFQF